MFRRTSLIVVVFLLVGMFVFAAQVYAWNFNGASVECEGFWQGNVDTGGTTTCELSGGFDVAVWCANSNNAGNIAPPKYTLIDSMIGYQTNANGKRERGRVRFEDDNAIKIVGTNFVSNDVCNQGGSNPNGNGQWYVVKVLPASAFTATVTTQFNNGSTRSEVYNCSGDFTSGSFASKVDLITQQIINYGPDSVGDLGLEYACSLQP